MRRPVRVMVLAIVALAAGCTFLIDFEHVDPGTEAGGNDATSNDVVANDAGDVTPIEGGPPGFPPPCDPNFPLADVKCNTAFPRPNCASNTGVFPTYPDGHERGGDLVTCNGSTKPTCVQHCPFGCAAMPVGYPDTCDDCNGRPDGTYCMKDLQGPDGRNLGLAIDCDGGKTQTAHVCGAASMCATKCTRASPKPSCCI